eukprot:31264-Pelagococcus_subviridis.AAC.6
MCVVSIPSAHTSPGSKSVVRQSTTGGGGGVPSPSPPSPRSRRVRIRGTSDASFVSQPLTVPSPPTVDVPYVSRTRSKSLETCDPAATNSAPSSVFTAPNGIHVVINLDVPRPRNTLSVCTPVNSPPATARSHLYAVVMTRSHWSTPSARSKRASDSVTARMAGSAATCCRERRPRSAAPSRRTPPPPSRQLASPSSSSSSSSSVAKHSGRSSASARSAAARAARTSSRGSIPRIRRYPSRSNVARSAFQSRARHASLESSIVFAVILPTPPMTCTTASSESSSSSSSPRSSSLRASVFARFRRGVAIDRDASSSETLRARPPPSSSVVVVAPSRILSSPRASLSRRRAASSIAASVPFNP